MTREQTKEAAVDTRDLDYQIGVMQAFKAGRKIEFRFRDTFDKAWHASVFPNWDWFKCQYRIKPAKTLRPWTEDEVPLGAWMRIKKLKESRFLITHTRSQFDRIEWHKDAEHSTDGGKTWLPCGVEEESK